MMHDSTARVQAPPQGDGLGTNGKARFPGIIPFSSVATAAKAMVLPLERRLNTIYLANAQSRTGVTGDDDEQTQHLHQTGSLATKRGFDSTWNPLRLRFPNTVPGRQDLDLSGKTPTCDEAEPAVGVVGAHQHQVPWYNNSLLSLVWATCSLEDLGQPGTGEPQTLVGAASPTAATIAPGLMDRIALPCGGSLVWAPKPPPVVIVAGGRLMLAALKCALNVLERELRYLRPASDAGFRLPTHRRRGLETVAAAAPAGQPARTQSHPAPAGRPGRVEAGSFSRLPPPQPPLLPD
ncbi:hypothetical protein GGTG_09074 [Gaeumannomyces tritici R3-111a-1]|uniref:Uncharacterized protein n=1 Tax=Gaeumannomyces tritici (strain R3-111a-1) TaxID=644352 RepID=J3P6D3_GAET3|nr:hypothetical protein GGTG_09074 [Gaeumannomyces tritici R3-111a-1]EJT72207.1 hypothetical protein GGTG_09074 [Gaeumannomyces tritici R3-111a-1]